LDRKEGFYTALGTPLDAEGRLAAESFAEQIEDQIAAGASGLLAMGTMGTLGCIRSDVYEDVISCACKAVNGRVRLLVGISDNSLARVKVKLDVLKRYPVDVGVITAPYYFQLSETVLESFFAEAAAMTDLDIYLYDHLPITKHKITYPMAMRLSQIPNIRGIKSGDLVLIKALFENPDLKSDFLPVFSGSDLFAVSNQYGIKNYLDGIFACFPRTISQVQKFFDAEEYDKAGEALNRMMAGRDQMFALGIWPAFSCAMNLLGYEGSFAPDYEPVLDGPASQRVFEILQKCGELDV
jgi:4-hydroxy-tetrahydrodipicolinate synthase